MARTVRSAEEIGREVRRLRKEKHLTQKRLGIELNTCDSSISKLENGTAGIDYAMITQICLYFGVSTDSIYFATDKDETELQLDNALELLRNMKKEDREYAIRMIRGLTLT